MQATPVTQAQYEAVMGENPCRFPSCGDDFPVVRVSWYDVQDFITVLNQQEGTTNYALPTEAQWEFAARAGSTTAFANGEITEIGSGWFFFQVIESCRRQHRKGHTGLQPRGWRLAEPAGRRMRNRVACGAAGDDFFGGEVLRV